MQSLEGENANKKLQLKKARKSRRQFACNDSLAEMIRVANLLPIDFRFDLTLALERGVPTYQYWYETFRELPDALKHELLFSPEVDEFIHDDSVEYWINNDAHALDKLYDMELDEQITEEEYNTLYRLDSSSIANFLVDYGYKGEDYAYSRQQEKHAEREWKRRLETETGGPDSSSFDEVPWTAVLSTHVPYIQALHRVQDIRDLLEGITKLADTVRQKDELEPEFSYPAIQRVLSERLSRLVRAAEIHITSSGEIQFSLSSWAEAIQNVSITRIRRCEVCDKFFWANRNDAFACSKLHAKSRYMRLMRQNWEVSGDMYKSQRKSKRNLKKS